MMERTNIPLTNNTITVYNNNTDYPKTTAIILHYQTQFYTLTETNLDLSGWCSVKYHHDIRKCVGLCCILLQ